MDRYQKFDTYGFDLLDDPTLRTTAKSYEFKYVPTDQLERIIQTVHKNRLKVKKNKITEDFSRPQTSKIGREQKSSKRFTKSIIKTPKSTVKILNPMKVTRESSNTSGDPPIVPKIRIMTDDEIQKVVENAVREVMQNEEVPKSQRSNRKEKCEEFVSKYFESFQGANNLEKDFKLDLSPMRKENEEHTDPERQERYPSPKGRDMKSPTTSSKGQRNKTSSRERSCASSVRSSQASTRTSAGPASTPRWETVNESGGSNRVEDLSEQDVKSVFSQSPTSTAHEITNSRQSLSSRSISETKRSTSEIDSESESTMYHDEGQERLEEGADLSQHKELNAYQVTSHTSREFISLLESQAILPIASDLKRFNNKENDNQSFDEKLSSDDDREDEENLNELLNQENLFPIIHIRRPTPIESDGSEQESCFGQKFDLGPEFPRLDAGDASKNADEGSSKHSGPKPDLSAHSPLKSSANKKLESPTKPLSSARQSPRKIPKPKDSARSPTSGRDQSKSPKIGSSRANELRQEAISIFSKITLYQEKIIELLDGIRRGLLNQSLSNGPSEKKRRDRFVIEFTARFKRNYLYQLERMFDDLEKISREQFFCKIHNENPMKICVIYGVLHQATTTYLKQIKHFLQDQFPRKLDVLLMYIIDITKLCIHKKVFDKDDALTQSLIMRCEDLLVFLADMEARRQQTLTPKKRQKTGATPKPGFSGWQAKPSLSMYEPQNPQPPPTRGVTRKKSGLTQKTSPAPTAKSKINQPSKTLLDPKSEPSKVKNLSTTKKSSSKTLRKQLKPKQDKPMKDFSNEEHKGHNKSLQEEIFSPEPRPADEGSREVIDPHSEATSTYIEARHEEKAEKDDTNMKDSVFEVLKTITEQELNKLLAPLVTNLGSMLNENPGVDLDTLLGSRKDFESQVVTRDTLEQKNDSARTNRVNSFKSIKDELSTRSEQQLEPRLSRRLGETLSQKTFIGATPIGEPHDVRCSTSSQLDMAAEFPSHEEMESFTWPNAMGGGDAARNPSQTGTVKQLRYEKNVQYTFVTSNEDVVPQNSPASEYEDPPSEDKNVCKIKESKEEIIPANEELQPKVSEVSVTKNIEGFLEERYNFLEQISSSPLYVNEFFSQPWKVVSSISEALVNEVTLSAEKDLSFGEDNYVDDFLQLELDM